MLSLVGERMLCEGATRFVLNRLVPIEHQPKMAEEIAWASSELADKGASVSFISIRIDTSKFRAIVLILTKTS